MKPSQCYNAYVDIRRRKNDSRTYFFDRASEKLNERIVKDDEGNGHARDESFSV